MTVQSKEINLDQLGGTIYPETTNGEQLRWHSPLEAPFHIAGFLGLRRMGYTDACPWLPGLSCRLRLIRLLIVRQAGNSLSHQFFKAGHKGASCRTGQYVSYAAYRAVRG